MKYKMLPKVVIGCMILMFCSCEGDGDSVSSLLKVGFDDREVGLYTANALNADWNSPPWNRGITEERVYIISGADAYSGNSMRILYPVGAVGMGDGGAGWRTEIGANEIINFSYRLKFKKGFDFVRGGKLPGLGGGRANTGGSKPAGDGWSARFMWRDGGRMSAYVYHMDQPRNYGEHFDASAGFIPGKWHRVKMSIKINSLGLRDGTITGWLDDKKVLDVNGLRFRNTSATQIDKILFETFFGGSGASYAPTRDEYIDFDEFMVWQ